MTADPTDLRTARPLTRLAAMALACAPLLLAVGSALVPAEVEEPVGGDPAVGLRHLALAAEHRDAVRAGYLLVVAGLALLAPAIIALVPTRDGRGVRTTAVGAALTSLALTLGTAVNLSGLLLYRATAPGLDRDAMAQLLARPSGALACILGYVVLFPVGMIVLTVGLWRSARTPRVLVLLLGTAGLLHIFSPAGWVGALLTVPLLTAGAGLAAHVWPTAPQHVNGKGGVPSEPTHDRMVKRGRGNGTTPSSSASPDATRTSSTP